MLLWLCLTNIIINRPVYDVLRSALWVTNTLCVPNAINRQGYFACFVCRMGQANLTSRKQTINISWKYITMAAYESIKCHKHERRHDKRWEVFPILLQDSLSLNKWSIVFCKTRGDSLLRWAWSLRIILLHFSVGCFVLESWRVPVNAAQSFKFSFIIY